MNSTLGQSCFTKKDYQDSVLLGQYHSGGVYLTKFEPLRGLASESIVSAKCKSIENLGPSSVNNNTNNFNSNVNNNTMYPSISSTPPPPSSKTGLQNNQINWLDRNGFRRFLEKNGTSSLKYSHSSHVLNPASTRYCETNNNNNQSSQTSVNLMSLRSHSLESNGHVKDSRSDLGHYYLDNLLKSPRSRSSSPHRSLRYRSPIARFIDSNGRIVECSNTHDLLPRKQLKTHLSTTKEDHLLQQQQQQQQHHQQQQQQLQKQQINLTCYRQYSPLVDKDGLLSQVNLRTMDSLKENLDFYSLAKNNAKNVSVKRRPSNLSFNRVLPPEERLYSPQSVKPFRSSSTLDPRRTCYQSYSGPTTPDREIFIGPNNRELYRKFSEPRSSSELSHRDQRTANHVNNNNNNGYQQYLRQQQYATIELIRSGTRKLWCELPQVRELGLLKDLSPVQRQLQEAMFEVITSEASYLKSLDTLVNHFENHVIMSNPSFLDPRRKADLFSNIHVIRDISYNLMNILEMRWRQSLLLSDVCDILVDYAYLHFSPYITYCRFKRRQESTLRELQLSSKFNLVLRQLECDPICQGLTLHSFLLLPVQRVTRYPLLVEAILRRLSPDSSQYRSAKRALFVTNKLVKECNTAANQYDKYLDLMSKLKFNNMKGFSVNEPRWLLMNVDVTRLKPETQSTLLIGTFRAPHWSNSSNVLSILSDMVLLSKKKGDELTVYDHCFRDLVQMRRVGKDTNERTIFNCKPPEQYKNLVKMTFLHNHCGKRVEYCLNFTSIPDQEECLTILDPKTNFIRTEQFLEPSWLHHNSSWQDDVVRQQQQQHQQQSSGKIAESACYPDQRNGHAEYSHEIFI